MTMKPFSAIKALAPLRATCRLSLVDSTVPVKGTHTGAGLPTLVGGTTTKALFVPSIGKSTLRPGFT